MPVQSPFARTATPGEMDQLISFLSITQTVDDRRRCGIEYDRVFNLKGHLREGKAANRNRDIASRQAHGARLCERSRRGLSRTSTRICGFRLAG